MVQIENEIFTFVHEKTTEIKNPDNDLIFTTDITSKPNHRVGILKPRDKIGEKIAYFYKHNLVFYQSNEVGEILTNYIKDTDGVVL